MRLAAAAGAFFLPVAVRFRPDAPGRGCFRAISTPFLALAPEEGEGSLARVVGGIGLVSAFTMLILFATWCLVAGVALSVKREAGIESSTFIDPALPPAMAGV